MRAAVLSCAHVSCRDLLGHTRRFLVLSVESKLLVLVPTSHGSLVAICPRELDKSDALTQEVVKTIMAVSGTCCCGATLCSLMKL